MRGSFFEHEVDCYWAPKSPFSITFEQKLTPKKIPLFHWSFTYQDPQIPTPYIKILYPADFHQDSIQPNSENPISTFTIENIHLWIKSSQLSRYNKGKQNIKSGTYHQVGLLFLAGVTGPRMAAYALRGLLIRPGYFQPRVSRKLRPSTSRTFI